MAPSYLGVGASGKPGAVHTAAYGYAVVRQFSEAGELDRGLRAIVPEEAAIVQRIFRDYVAGMSPRRIAMALNAEGIPGPGGGAWYNSSILGRAKRGDGLLRNQLYIGKLVWRRRVNAKDPTTGATVRRDADPDTYVVREVPSLRIIDDELWGRVQQRLNAEAAPVKGNQPAFWDRRRPRHLLSGKVICGGCGRPFSVFGQDYLGCNAARHGTCHNRRTIRRPALEARVLDSLGRQLMDPGRVAEFVATFHAEWNRLAAEARAQVNVEQRERAALDRKIANLVDAISEGRSSQALRAKLTELEGQRAKLGEAPEPALSPAPLLQPSIASTYAAKVADLRSALAVGANPEAMEAARALIERVVVHPPEIDDDPPRIELIGELMALLTTAGLGANDNRAGASRPDPVLELFVSSVKAAPGAKPRSSLILSAPSIRTTTRAV